MDSMQAKQSAKGNAMSELVIRLRELRDLSGLARSSYTIALGEAADEIERLQAFVREQLCECHDEYGKRKPAPCERCQLLYGYETWARYDAERRPRRNGVAKDLAKRKEDE